MEGTCEEWKRKKPGDRRVKEGAGGGEKGPVPRALQWQGLRRERGKEKREKCWGLGKEWGGWAVGIWGDSQVRAGRGGGGEVKADEALKLGLLESRGVAAGRREALVLMPGNLEGLRG